MTNEDRNLKTAMLAINAFNTGDITNVHEFVSSEYINKESQKHKDSYRSQLKGPDEFIDTIRNLRSAFPDLTYKSHEYISQNDKVVYLATVEGTHTGNFFFVPPTGNKISYQAVHVFTIGNDGKILEHSAIRDDLQFMLQLGLVKGSSDEYDKFLREWKKTE